jgi:hypothetical protein
VSAPDRTETTKPIRIRRALPWLLFGVFTVPFFAGFVIAEQDAYRAYHDGFVHDPTGFLTMLFGLVGMLASGPISVWFER